MRVATAAEIKGGRTTTTSDYPHEGSLAKRIFDKLKGRSGRPVDLSEFYGGGAFYQSLTRLTDDYGCDIRKVGNCHQRTYILAGEWFGPHYSDYVVQAIDEAMRKGEAA